jgi:hypothetical protein
MEGRPMSAKKHDPNLPPRTIGFFTKPYQSYEIHHVIRYIEPDGQFHCEQRPCDTPVQPDLESGRFWSLYGRINPEEGLRAISDHVSYVFACDAYTRITGLPVIASDDREHVGLPTGRIDLVEVTGSHGSIYVCRHSGRVVFEKSNGEYSDIERVDPIDLAGDFKVADILCVAFWTHSGDRFEREVKA